jgi:aryl sulfotransferase
LVRRCLGVAQPHWPAKRRELKHRLIDSTVWNDFKFREGDIVIASWAKSGTTWMQQIVAQLVFDGAEGIAVSKISPWVELRLLPPQARAALDMQTHRRFVKTHLPVDALVFSRLAKFIYIGRDGRDAAWSLYNHFANYKPARLDEINNAGGEGPLLEPTIGAGSRVMAIRCGRSGSRCGRGGRSAICPTSYSFTSTT